MIKRKNPAADAARFLLVPALTILAMLLLLLGLSNLSAGGSAEEKKQIADTIRRDAVTCYATEGVYPPSLSYLEEHYGLHYDKKHYVVSYHAFADNLMPDITVLQKNPDGRR